MVYIFMVETNGLSLEQIEDVFEAPEPVKYSKVLRSEAKQKADARA